MNLPNSNHTHVLLDKIVEDRNAKMDIVYPLNHRRNTLFQPSSSLRKMLGKQIIQGEDLDRLAMPFTLKKKKYSFRKKHDSIE